MTRFRSWNRDRIPVLKLGPEVNPKYWEISRRCISKSCTQAIDFACHLVELVGMRNVGILLLMRASCKGPVGQRWSAILQILVAVRCLPPGLVYFRCPSTQPLTLSCSAFSSRAQIWLLCFIRFSITQQKQCVTPACLQNVVPPGGPNLRTKSEKNLNIYFEKNFS